MDLFIAGVCVRMCKTITVSFSLHTHTPDDKRHEEKVSEQSKACVALTGRRNANVTTRTKEYRNSRAFNYAYARLWQEENDTETGAVASDSQSARRTDSIITSPRPSRPSCSVDRQSRTRVRLAAVHGQNALLSPRSS